MKVKQPYQLLHIRKQISRLENDPYCFHEIHKQQRHEIDYAICNFLAQNNIRPKEVCHWQ